MEDLSLLHQENFDFLRHLFLEIYSNGPGVAKNWHIWPKRICGDVLRCLCVQIWQNIPMGSVPNCQLEIPNSLLLGGLSVNLDPDLDSDRALGLHPRDLEHIWGPQTSLLAQPLHPAFIPFVSFMPCLCTPHTLTLHPLYPAFMPCLCALHVLPLHPSCPTSAAFSALT